ncbi:MAG: B12-binding domain-containing radical SAM protein [Candidatus Omnitrophica bacterium]|nr:B12-binding domain-containing radical SAM protein [Candidatus Omnitrophota bacterium]
MRVVFIDPPAWQKGLNVGLAYLASVLIRDGIDVKVIDMNNVNLDMGELKRILLDFAPDVIGYSVKSNTAKEVSRLSKFTKELFPRSLHIAGGPHITLYAEEFIKDNPAFDILLAGEGEGVIGEILKGAISGGSYKERIIYSPFVPALDILSFPNFDSFLGLKIENFSWPLITSRGCPFNCIYCCVGKISGKRIRMRSPESVVAEIEDVVEKYRIKRFEILDDCFNIDIERVKKICNLILKKEIKIGWSCPNGLRADRIDKELAEMMVRSGCDMVMFGIETVDRFVFEKIGKNENLEDIIRSIKIFKDFNIKVGGFFIIGLPGSSKKDIDKDIDFIRRYRLDFAHFNLLVPYPNTDVWQWIERNGRFIRDYKEGMHFGEDPKPVFETDGFSQDEMVECFMRANIIAGNIHWFLPERLSLWERRKKIISLCWRYDKKELIRWIYIFLKNKIPSMFN